MTDLEKAFIKFKQRYHAFVQTETILDQCNDSSFVSIEKKARLFKQQADDAERALKQMMGLI